MVNRVLVVATSRKTRGGITAVLKAHEKMAYWRKYHCHWVQTHRDGPAWRKIAYFVVGLADFLIRLPFYDTVHVHTADWGTEKRKRIFVAIAKLCGKRIVVHLHSSGPEYSIGGEHRSLYRSSFKAADRIIMLSHDWMEFAKIAFPEMASKMAVIYNPCPIVELCLDVPATKYFLFAGTLTHRKGYDDLMRAFAIVSHYIPEWRLVIAGNGDIDGGIAMAKELGIDARVDFVGWVSGDNKDKIFREASAYCLPSYSEGFPMGVLDAMAYGLPVITTPVGGIPDVAINGENMLLFEPGDITALAEALRLVATDISLRERLSSASVELANGKFHASNISKDIEALYASL